MTYIESSCLSDKDCLHKKQKTHFLSSRLISCNICVFYNFSLQELGFSYVELNASDTRSKRSLKEVVAESLDNNTLVDYTGAAGGQSGGPSGQSHCLIMDEVDGMAGNEDRGGLQVGRWTFHISL